jgi:hypothetical protein
MGLVGLPCKHKILVSDKKIKCENNLNFNVCDLGYKMWDN